jgi:Fe-S-cluster-containing hydrogenase component 2
MCNVQCPMGVAELALLEPRAAVAAAALDETCQIKQVIKQREQRLAACASVCDSEMSWRAGRGAFQGRGTVKTVKTRGHLTTAMAPRHDNG